MELEPAAGGCGSDVNVNPLSANYDDERQHPSMNNEVSSHVPKPPSDNPSDVLPNASTKVDEDHSERDVEPNLSNTPMQMEQRQMSEPNGDANNESSRSMKMQDEYHIASSDDDESPTSSTTKHEQSSNWPRNRSSESRELFGNFGSETKYPPMQVMERPADTASPSSYRIPSHVFARQPTAGAEWSVASNESLFSIHVGNMSFSKDMYWLGKYDELDKPGETSRPGSQTNMSGGVSSNQSPTQIANQISLSKPTLDNEERAEETMREVVMENTDNLKKGTHRPSLSRHSEGSAFAFPVLTDIESNESPIVFQDKQKTEMELHPQTHQEIPEEDQQLEETSDEPKQPTSATAAISNGRFSCFSCCA